VMEFYYMRKDTGNNQYKYSIKLLAIYNVLSLISISQLFKMRTI
jgi:hypothetical protein